MHDSDGSGAVDIGEVARILLDHAVTVSPDELKRTFAKYDLDLSHTLEFEEFCSLMVDLDAASQIVQKRSNSYDLPEHMQKWFSKIKLDEYTVQFGMFDDSGDGEVDAQELRAVMRALGNEMSHDDVMDLIATVDMDKGGTINFPEFISLMRKIDKGEIDIGGGLAQAIMASKPAVRLRQEGAEFDANPMDGVKSVLVLKKPIQPPTCEVVIYGPEYSPYAGYYVKMKISITNDYPFTPPKVRFSHRILHINVDMMLDGTCCLNQITKMWDGGWNLRMLITYFVELLGNPDTRLLPENIRAKYNLIGMPVVNHDEEFVNGDFSAESSAIGLDLASASQETENSCISNISRNSKDPNPIHPSEMGEYTTYDDEKTVFKEEEVKVAAAAEVQEKVSE